MATTCPPDGRGPRRRDRHGRGLRGPLTRPGVPLSLTRSERFTEMVLTSVQRLQRRWAAELASVVVAVEDVPDPDLVGPEPAGLGHPGHPEDLGHLGHLGHLGRCQPASGDRPARLVVFRRAVEARARGPREREHLVHDVLVGLLAELLGLDPATVDPDSADAEHPDDPDDPDGPDGRAGG